MQSIIDEEFEILGLKLKFKPGPSQEDTPSTVTAGEVVEYIQSEIIEVQKQSKKQLDATQIAILVALKSASEKLEMERGFATKLKSLEKTATDALEYLNEVTPVKK
jgi:hypothetical protein